MADIKTKVCSKCKTEKDINDFYVRKASFDGLTPRCKNCISYYRKEFYKKHLDEIKEKSKEWNRKYIAVKLKNNKIWKEKNPEKYKQSINNWRLKNSERVKAVNKIWYKKNSDKAKENSKNWIAKNIDKARLNRRRASSKIRSTPKGKINNCIAAAINRQLNGSKCGRKWLSLVDFSLQELMSHLEKQFKPGMSWENQGQWHIDHKIPLSVFNFETPEHIDFKRCWALRNLQPLWRKENQSKKDKLDYPFQPSLLISVNE